MAYIKQINLGENSYLIEPILYVTPQLVTNTVNYTATLANFTLETGVTVQVHFTDTNPAAATLNINNTGDKPIYYENIPVMAQLFTANRTYAFVYNGSYWNVIGDIADKNVILGTTAYWQQNNTYIAPRGTIIVYTDHGTYTSNNTTITVPGIKISDGLAYAIDLPFVGDDVAAAIRNELNTHINDSIKHVTVQDRTRWDNKLNCDLDGETLIFNRS